MPLTPLIFHAMVELRLTGELPMLSTWKCVHSDGAYRCKKHTWVVAWLREMSSDIGRIGLIGHKQELLGKVGAVLGGLRRMQAQSDEAAKAMANCWDYLNAHRGRTYYRQLRRGGYPLGRGGIESSNKFIGHVRLKRSGAWWYEVNSNHLLALRCAKYNGTLDQVFGRHRERLREMSE
jgi:hypothetical protein